MIIYDRSGKLLREIPDDDKTSFSEMDLSNADFSGKYLRCCFFDDAILTRADFSRTNLYSSYFYRAQCSGAPFISASLQGAVLDEADLTEADLSSADLSRDGMNGSTSLRGTCLLSAKLENANLSGAYYDDETRFPLGFNPESAGMITESDTMLTPTYQSLPSFHLAGIRRWHTFAAAPETIPPQWNEFNALPLPGRAETKVTYGSTCQMDMPNQRFEYLSGYEVPSFDNLPADIGRMIVPAAEYAVFPLDTVKDIRPFWQSLFQTWLPSSGVKPAHTPDFERYDHRFDPITLGPLEIWFPTTR